MTFLDPILDLFRGKAVTIPPLDGALKPNTALDEAEVVVAALAPDNIVRRGDDLLYSSGPEIRHIASFTLPLWRAGEVPELTGPEFERGAPFPFELASV